MIPKYRKSGLFRLGFGFGLMLVALFIASIADRSELRKLVDFVCVVMGIIGYLVFVYGCSDLLKAKGYDSGLAIAFIIPAFCCSPVFIFIAPIIIIFGLQDKNKRRR
jgi:hypothetical protein